jgi:hypothetical protein
MNRLNGMQGSEAQLKVLVDRLAQMKDKGLSDRTERAYLRMLLRARLVAMRSTIDGITRTMTEAERDEFSWQVRMGIPLFCHLESVLSFLDEGALEVSAA